MARRRVWVAGAVVVAFGLGIATGAVLLKARQAGFFAGTPLGQPRPSTAQGSPTPALRPPAQDPGEAPLTACDGAFDPTAFVAPPVHHGPFDSIALPKLAQMPALDGDGAPIDQTGVHIHPAGTADFGIAYLNIGDQPSAMAMARALLAASVREGDKLWFPYHFPFDVDPWHLPPGWVSGFTQGLSLAFFARLSEATGDATYGEAADAIFRTMLPGEGVSRIDGQDFWVEEYPETPPNTVYNGHVYGTLGLYEYDRVVGDPRARELALQGIGTIRRHLSAFVMADGSAYYDAGRFTGKINGEYHQLYIQMFSWLGSITGEPCFLDAARAVAAPLAHAP